MQEHALDPIHFLAQHEPRLAQGMQCVAAAPATLAVVGIHNAPRAAVMDLGARHSVGEADDRLEERPMVRPPLRLQGAAAVVHPGRKQQRAEEYCGDKSELQPPLGTSSVAHSRCPRLRKFQTSMPASTTAIANH